MEAIAHEVDSITVAHRVETSKGCYSSIFAAGPNKQTCFNRHTQTALHTRDRSSQCTVPERIKGFSLHPRRTECELTPNQLDVNLHSDRTIGHTMIEHSCSCHCSHEQSNAKKCTTNTLLICLPYCDLLQSKQRFSTTKKTKTL